MTDNDTQNNIKISKLWRKHVHHTCRYFHLQQLISSVWIYTINTIYRYPRYPYRFIGRPSISKPTIIKPQNFVLSSHRIPRIKIGLMSNWIIGNHNIEEPKTSMLPAILILRTGNAVSTGFEVGVAVPPPSAPPPPPVSSLIN